MANFILAALIYGALFMVGSTEYSPTTQTPKDNTVLAQSGLQAPARILRVDGRAVSGWQSVLMALSDRLGETGRIELDVYNLRQGREQTLQLPIATWLQEQTQPDVLGALGLQPVLLSVVGEVVADSPASVAGLKPGDWVTGVNERNIALWREWVDEIVKYPNTPMSLTVVRGGQTLQLSATPGVRNDAEGKPIGFLGVSPDLVEVKFPPIQALLMGWTETLDKTAMTLSMLEKMVVGLLSVQNLVGPVGIAQIAGIQRNQLADVLRCYGAYEHFLGCFELAPVPLLDGGQIVLVSIEAIKGSPVSDRIQQGAVQLGLLLVGLMFVLVTFNDLTRLFS
ncbi:MAG: hypothetical protein CM15mP120_22340 [Pseudomonadota bacterium]|nr:MAG: hypothetical protein CM15mP120_22340 [Pseudomonadota bacterium]